MGRHSDLAEPAQRFIQAFNTLFEEELPAAIPDNTKWYWDAYSSTDIEGRCVCLGVDDPARSTRHYHWAICRDSAGQLTVQDFWHPDVWTTAAYQGAMTIQGRCPELLRRAGRNDPGAYRDILL